MNRFAATGLVLMSAAMMLPAQTQNPTFSSKVEAVRVDAALTMKVPFASLRRETSTWVRPGTGPVAVRSDERVLVMGIVPRNRSETRVRLPVAVGAL